MSVIIRGVGAAWTGLFGLICLARLAMPFFLPIGRPGSVPIPLRVAGLALYLTANPAAGIYAAMSGSKRPYGASMVLSIATPTFAVTMVLVVRGLQPHARGTSWQAEAIVELLAAVAISAAATAAILTAALVLRHRGSASAGLGNGHAIP